MLYRTRRLPVEEQPKAIETVVDENRLQRRREPYGLDKPEVIETVEPKQIEELTDRNQISKFLDWLKSI